MNKSVLFLAACLVLVSPLTYGATVHAGIFGFGEEPDELDDLDHWLEKFRIAFSSPKGAAEELITAQNISMSIAEYERSQVFVNTPWKRYVQGDERAISWAAKKGAILFFTPNSEGGANCSSCHSGDFFTDESFHNLAMPQIGPGKGDGEDGSKDFGRARETGLEKDKFSFRTPSLLNVEVTGPWSHTGAYSSLEAVIRHHLNARRAIKNYDYSQLSQDNIRNLKNMQENTEEALNFPNFALDKIYLNNRSVYFLVEFLKSLTDPCTINRECLSPWILDEDTRNDPNGHQLNAVDQFGEKL
ncbi:MAG: hypothetical protein L3J59_10505 [Methylococcaceae bacterium]|nr:hypothetical protein [Methylococcaceae bacterium]